MKICACEVRGAVQKCIQDGQSSQQKGWHSQIRAVYKCSLKSPAVRLAVEAAAALEDRLKILDLACLRLTTGRLQARTADMMPPDNYDTL